MLDTSGFEFAGQFQQPSAPLLTDFLLSGNLQLEDQKVESFPIAPLRIGTLRANQIANRRSVLPGFCKSLP